MAETASRNIHERLSLPLPLRLPLGMVIGGSSGFFLGIAKGSQDSGMRFRAENAHRQPSTQTGWYLYHKSKNYHMALGGIVEGVKQGFRFSLWSGLFFLLEEGVDRGRASAARSVHRLRGEMARRGHSDGFDSDDMVPDIQISRDCLSSMLAGLGTAGFFSAWNRFPLPTAARTAKLGAKAGLAFGLLQDCVSLLRGRKLGYVEFVKRHTIGSSDGVETSSPAIA